MEEQERVFLNSVFFVLGFTLVFAVLGILLQTVLSQVSFAAMGVIRDIGGGIIIAFGILLIASTKYIIPVFSAEHRVVRFKRYRSGYVSSLVFGIGFALGWTPCVGAILGSIYVLAATSPGVGFLLLLAYALGLGIPFLVVGFFVSKLAGFIRRIRGFLRYFNIVSGAFLVTVGMLVLTGDIGLLSVFLLSLSVTSPMSHDLNFLVALAAGFLTFLSPCILPLVPAYFSYMAGTAAQA